MNSRSFSQWAAAVAFAIDVFARSGRKARVEPVRTHGTSKRWTVSEVIA
jgi:hypothetical protein